MEVGSILQTRYLKALHMSALIVISLLVLTTGPFVGMTELNYAELFVSGTNTHEIVWNLRLPRVCLAYLAGAALASGGMVFQALFRNILATPFTLGISSGAAFGAALYYKMGFSFSFRYLNGSALFGLAGALGTIVLVLLLAAPAQGMSTLSMLLAGVILSFFFSSLILLLQYLSDFAEVFQITRWLMGSLDVVGYNSIIAMGPFVLAGLLIIIALARSLDLLSLGDDLAQARGLSAAKARLALFAATSLMIGGVVSVCGPIGFVGLIVPYLCRALLGSGHLTLALACLLAGGSFLTICDSLGRIIIAPAEIPVGVITALLGGPFFLWVLRRRESFRTLTLR